MTDSLFDSMPLAPVDLPDAFDDVPDEPAPKPRRFAPAPGAQAPAYGLVGLPASTVRTRDVKVFARGAGIGGLLAVMFSWFGRRGV